MMKRDTGSLDYNLHPKPLHVCPGHDLPVHVRSAGAGRVFCLFLDSLGLGFRV